VIEIVSNLEGGEDTSKLERYARMKVPYYVICDPALLLSQRPLQIRQLSGASYVDKVDTWFPEIGLGLTIQSGTYDGLEGKWLRWCDDQGAPLLTGIERAQAEAKRAEAEARRAEQEQQRRLALEARLLELGESL